LSFYRDGKFDHTEKHERIKILDEYSFPIPGRIFDQPTPMAIFETIEDALSVAAFAIGGRQTL